ncbi:MAG: hypothetical protein HXY20_05690 [Acidobacteria bacterium]|nr:hypothetical protein [Acidobacteriota bacterium]
MTFAFQIFNTLQGGQINIPWTVIDEVRNRSAKGKPSSISLADPWAAVAGGNPFPTRVDPASLKFPASGSYTANTLNLPVGYVHQFNLSIQRQFGASMVTELSYVANRGHDLVGSYNINQAVLSPTGTAADIDSRRPLGAAPFRDMTQFQSNVRSWYDSLQARFEKRFSRGYSILGSYTLGKAIDYASWHDSSSTWADPRKPELNKALADYDRRQILSVSFLWDLPIFHHAPGLRQTLLGGWQLSGIVSYYAGAPFLVSSGQDHNLDGQSSNDRPNVTGDWTRSRPSNAEIKAGATWFDTSACLANKTGEIGTLGRNVLVGPPRRNFDLGLAKSFRFREQQSISFRLESFNLFNTVNLNNPEGRLNNGNFGMITGADSPRILQIGLRYSF